MRIFSDPVEMHDEVRRDLFEMGTRYQTSTVQDKDVSSDARFRTIELFGYAYQLHDVGESSLRVMLDHVGADVPWATAEMIERLHGTGRTDVPVNPGKAWERRADFWGPFVREGAFAYSYAERWLAQLPYVIREIRARPSTRQAMITMYDQHQDMMNWGGRDRVPCSVSYQFAVRGGTMHVVYCQRSCDFVKFFPYDVFFTCGLLRHVASECDFPAGTMTHFLGSLHAFAGDLEGRGIF